MINDNRSVLVDPLRCKVDGNTIKVSEILRSYGIKSVLKEVWPVVSIDDEYAKVYWIHAQRGLWILKEKLTTFENLEDFSARYQ